MMYSGRVMEQRSSANRSKKTQLNVIPCCATLRSHRCLSIRKVIHGSPLPEQACINTISRTSIDAVQRISVVLWLFIAIELVLHGLALQQKVFGGSRKERFHHTWTPTN